MPSRLANSWSDRARPLTSSSNHARPRAIALISAGSHVELRRGLLLGPDVASSASETASDSAVELTATAAFTRRGAETKLVLPGLAPQKHSSRCDPALIKAIARGARGLRSSSAAGPALPQGGANV